MTDSNEPKKPCLACARLACGFPDDVKDGKCICGAYKPVAPGVIELGATVLDKDGKEVGGDPIRRMAEKAWALHPNNPKNKGRTQ